jgi:hypothetical protein
VLLAPLHSPAGFVCSMHFLGQKRPYDATGLYDPTFATAVCQSDDLTQLFPVRCPMVSPEGPPGGLPNASRWFRQLRRRRPKGGQTSLRDIAAELAQRGIMNERGVPFSAASINAMLAHDPQARPFWCSVARRRRQPSQPTCEHHQARKASTYDGSRLELPYRDGFGRSAPTFACPSLIVTPSTNIAFSGPQGGPFSPTLIEYRISASTGTVSYSIRTPS